MMPSVLLRILRPFLSLPSSATTCAGRGFCMVSKETTKQLEEASAAFRLGYHGALDSVSFLSLEQYLNEIDVSLRGFAYEGAAMGIALTDRFRSTKSERFSEFLDGIALQHRYMVYIGLGWVLARFPRGVLKLRSRLDPILWPLAVAGAGFHMGYFFGKKYLQHMTPPWYACGPWRSIFDQGYGRSLWFQMGGQSELLQQAIDRFPVLRHEDLWSGVGLACAYAGGSTRDAISRLFELSNGHKGAFAQGAAFAVTARETAGTPSRDCIMACDIVLRRPPDLVRSKVDFLLSNIRNHQIPEEYRLSREEAGLCRYQNWRKLLREEFYKSNLAIRPQILERKP